MNRPLHARRSLADQHGAVVVQAAIAMMTLLGLSVFVVDYGILWLSRQQAQNAADAGAIAAAVARAYDDDTPLPSTTTGIVAESAEEMVNLNPVWFETAASDVSYTCPPDAGSVRCVKVDVYRDVAHSNPLPMIFGPVLGRTTQNVVATATAQVAVGNATTCLKPWAIPDKWIEHRPVDKSWAAGDVFQKYVEPSGGTELVPADEYVAPSDSDEGTGLTLADDLGLLLTLTFANPEASDPITPGFLIPLVLPGLYDENIVGCNGQLTHLGAEIPTGASSLLGATGSGFSDLVSADLGASWNAATNSVQGSCAPGPCGAISPRLVALVLFDVDQYQLMRARDVWCLGGVRCVKVANIVGFFIQDSDSTSATGYVTKYPGLLSPGNPTLLAASSFLPAVTLVR